MPDLTKSSPSSQLVLDFPAASTVFDEAGIDKDDIDWVRLLSTLCAVLDVDIVWNTSEGISRMLQEMANPA